MRRSALARKSPMPAPSKPMARTAIQRSSAPLYAIKTPRSAALPPPGEGTRTRKSAARQDTIPPRVRALVAKRDQRMCLHCCSTRGLHKHHRRLKGIGGDTRPCTDCPCNIVDLCWLCHDYMHLHRREAEALGYIIPNDTAEPGLIPVTVHTADGGFTAWPTCTGEWVFESPAGAP